MYFEGGDEAASKQCLKKYLKKQVDERFNSLANSLDAQPSVDDSALITSLRLYQRIGDDGAAVSSGEDIVWSLKPKGVLFWAHEAGDPQAKAPTCLFAAFREVDGWGDAEEALTPMVECVAALEREVSSVGGKGGSYCKWRMSGVVPTVPSGCEILKLSKKERESGTRRAARVVDDLDQLRSPTLWPHWATARREVVVAEKAAAEKAVEEAKEELAELEEE
eukprot:COSAG04_NODE_69_length_29236_cov_15.813680_27_plen_221_part_00